MRRVTIDEAAVSGSPLARPVVAPSGEVLAGAGLCLTPRAGRSLREHGVATCFVDDVASSGVVIVPIVDMRGADAPFVDALAALFGLIARPLWRTRQEPTSQAIESIQQLRVMPEALNAAAMSTLRASVGALAGRLAGAVPDCGLVSDRHPADDLVGHSAAVAVVAMRLAYAVGFTYEDVVTTGIAALLHDVGLILVPDEVRRLPAELRTAGQQRRWQDHTLLGEALLRPLTVESPSFPVVALQHHEEQGGRGFPNGLIGGNRLLRSTDAGVSRMALISELVAVADRYERLVGGAPGEMPLSPATARHVLAAEAGPRLNAEVVGRFLDVIPRWPTGTEVILHGGRYEGMRAIVIEPIADAPDRPNVRAFATSDHAIDPFDFALTTAPDVDLSAIDGRAA